MRGPDAVTRPRHEPRLSSRISRASVPGRLSPGSYHTMLKHKLRKSRKNILSLLDYVQEQEEDAKIPEYSEIKKPGRKEKKKKGKSRNWLIYFYYRYSLRYPSSQ